MPPAFTAQKPCAATTAPKTTSGDPMALVKHLEFLDLQIEAKHTNAPASYSLVKDSEGVPYLQIDTYGSPSRKIKGKKSQSIRLAPTAIAELSAIIKRHFGNPD
jgi:hypothetical protein